MKLILGPIIGEVLHNRAKIWIFWHKDSDNETAPNALFLKMKYVLKKFLNQNF